MIEEMVRPGEFILSKLNKRFKNSFNRFKIFFTGLSQHILNDGMLKTDRFPFEFQESEHIFYPL